MTDPNKRPAAVSPANGPWVNDQASELINPKSSEKQDQPQEAQPRRGEAEWSDAYVDSLVLKGDIPRRARPGIADDLTLLNEHLDLLNNWEKGFILDVSGRCTFSRKHEAKIVSTAAKIRRKLSYR